MARPWLWLVLRLITASGARLTGYHAPGPGLVNAAPRAAAELPKDLVWDVLSLVPGPPVVAWDTASWKCGGGRGVRVLRRGGEPPEWTIVGPSGRLHFCPAGDRLIKLGLWDGDPAMILDARTGRPQRPIVNLQSRVVLAAQVFPGGDRMATLSVGRMQVWDARSGEAMQGLDVFREQPRFFRILSASRLAIWQLFHDRAAAMIWDLESESLRQRFRQPRGDIFMLEASPCASILVTSTALPHNIYATPSPERDDVVFVWDAETGQLLRELRASGDRIRDIKVSYRGDRIVIEGEGQLFVFDGVTGELRRRLTLEGRLLLIPGGRHVAAFNSWESFVWDLQSAARTLLQTDVGVLQHIGINTMKGYPRVAVSPCGRLLAACNFWRWLGSSGLHHSVAVWDIRSGRLVFSEEGEGQAVQNMCDVAVVRANTMADELRALSLGAA